MNRPATGVVGILLVFSAAMTHAQGTFPGRTLSEEPTTEYGESAEFWKTHTLVIATLDGTRLEYGKVPVVATVHVSLRVQESVPSRFAAGDRLALQFPTTVSVRDRPEYLPGLKPGDRLMVLLEGSKGLLDVLHEGVRLGMMPGGSAMYRITKSDDPVVAETKSLCRALSTENVRDRLELIGVLVKGKPSEHAKTVLRRSLEALDGQLRGNLEETHRLLKEVR